MAAPCPLSCSCLLTPCDFQNAWCHQLFQLQTAGGPLPQVLQHNLELQKELMRIRECNSRAAEVLFGSPGATSCRDECPGSPAAQPTNRVAFAPASPDLRFSGPLRHWAEDSGNMA